MALSPVFVAEIFEQSSLTRYSFRSGNRLRLPPANTLSYGTHSISFIGSLLWNRLPKSIKNSTSFLEFKNCLKKFSTKICFCSICSDSIFN